MDVTFQWVGGATFILTVGGIALAVDPVLCEKGKIQDFFWFKSKRVEDPIYQDHDFNHIDLWLLTHEHEDHIDAKGMMKISQDSDIVCDKKTSKLLLKRDIRNLRILGWGEETVFQMKDYQVVVEAVPAIHGVNPLSAFFAGTVNGYYVSISQGNESFHVYITGDTVYKKKVIKALKGREIDLLVPNMGAVKQGSWMMCLTLNAVMLKKMTEELNPKLVVPVHFGAFEHYIEPVEAIKNLGDDKIKILAPGDRENLVFTN